MPRSFASLMHLTASITTPDVVQTSLGDLEFFDGVPDQAAVTAVYDYIDANLDDHLGAIQRWLRQRSISAQNDGIQEMAAMVRQDLENMGFDEAEIVAGDITEAEIEALFGRLDLALADTTNWVDEQGLAA